MSEAPRMSGPQFRADDDSEQEAVRTTIVGGRPPGSGQRVGQVPRGVEVLVKKAAVDPSFRESLIAQRAAAADAIGLELTPAEMLMLQAAPADQLQAIISRTKVPNSQRRAFLGTAASAMLAVLAGGMTGCGDGPGPEPVTTGIAPDYPPEPAPTGIAPDLPPESAPEPPVTGIAPDLPPEPSAGAEDPGDAVSPERPENVTTLGIQPDRPPVSRGIRPDTPPTAEPPGAEPE